MNRIKVWPHMTIVAVVVALVAGLGVGFWMKHEQTASAEELPYAARIQRVDGEVAFSDGLANPPNTSDTDDGEANGEWVAATANQPFSVGDRIYTRDNSRTSLAFSGRNFARLDPNTSLDVVSLSDRRTQLALRDGSAMFDVGYLQPDELFEVATPNGAVSFDQPGLYNVGFDNNGGVLVSVLSGLAQVAGLGGSGQINKGEMLTLLGQTAAELALSRLNPGDAGNQVDDYYRYQYPNSYDGRYNDYDAYLEDPDYYDPYQRNVSYQYASSTIPGINDLDYYGDWQNVDGYGNAWRPRVDSDWVPYQEGQWTNDYPYGPTWVSSEPWGYAPYHYGRWANVGNQWYWVPDGVNTTPAYAPALVAFVPMDDANQIGWVPLGPGDTYAPRYYDDNWQPRYLTRANVVPEQLINLGIPGSVTVVPLDAFGRDVDRRSIRRIDQQRLASGRSTLDPLTLTPLRNAVTHSAWGRRDKMDLPPGIAKRLRDTPVFVGRDIRESRFRKNVARSMRVERVSEKDRNRKFKVRDDGDGRDARQGRDDRDGRGGRGERDNREARQDRRDSRQEDRGRNQAIDQARKQEIDRRSAAATRDRSNRDAQRQARDLEQQQGRATRDQQRNNERTQQRAERRSEQPRGERVANPAKQESRGESKPERKQESRDSRRQGRGEGGKGKGKGKP